MLAIIWSCTSDRDTCSPPIVLEDGRADGPQSDDFQAMLLQLARAAT
jgi:hypothetical protein